MAAEYGLMAEFDTPEEIVNAVEKTKAAGFEKIDAYAPFPVHGLAEALGFTKSRIPMVVFIGGLTGGILGYLLQWWCSAIAYPLNVGGRPLNSVPAFIPITFEMTILFAAFSAVFGMFLLNGLPLPYHPVFNVERFAMASRNHFFLCIESKDPKFSVKNTRAFLESLKPRGVYDIEE